MRTSPLVFLAGVAVAALAGYALGAAANLHTLTLRLPDGGVERIVYTGDAAPALAYAPLAAPDPIFWPDEPAARLVALGPDMIGAHVCARSVEITDDGRGSPKVVSRQSGDCGAAASPVPATAAVPGPTPDPDAPRLTRASF